jgi:hypothetical protein
MNIAGSIVVDSRQRWPEGSMIRIRFGVIKCLPVEVSVSLLVVEK